MLLNMVKKTGSVRLHFIVERRSSAVERRTRNQVSPGSNPLFATVSKIGNFRSLH